MPNKHTCLRILALLSLLLYMHTVAAQHRRTQAYWLGYYFQSPLQKRWFISGDVQVRSRDGLSHWAQQLFRAGLGYTAGRRWTLLAGGAWFRHARYNNGTLQFGNEWRPWQELGYKIAGRKLSGLQRLRTEQRWMQSMVHGKPVHQYNMVFRLRYRTELQWALSKKWTPAIINEFMINPGKWRSDVLDQNRTALSINYHTSAAITLQLQYINIWLWKNRSLTEEQHVIRLNLVHQWKRQ